MLVLAVGSAGVCVLTVIAILVVAQGEGGVHSISSDVYDYLCAFDAKSPQGNLNDVVTADTSGEKEMWAPTPLVTAAAQGHLEVVEALVKSGASDLSNALFFASQNGHADVVTALLKLGADPNHSTDAINAMFGEAMPGLSAAPAIRLASSSFDGAVRLWNITDGTPVQETTESNTADQSADVSGGVQLSEEARKRHPTRREQLQKGLTNVLEIQITLAQAMVNQASVLSSLGDKVRALGVYNEAISLLRHISKFGE